MWNTFEEMGRRYKVFRMSIYWVQKVDRIARILSECTASTMNFRRKEDSMLEVLSHFKFGLFTSEFELT